MSAHHRVPLAQGLAPVVCNRNSSRWWCAGGTENRGPASFKAAWLTLGFVATFVGGVCSATDLEYMI